uniref:Uncharacterized protein n=1 Tax=Oryza punctata TaxID=4537 RepID=A0A0E0KH44_ORYPU
MFMIHKMVLKSKVVLKFHFLDSILIGKLGVAYHLNSAKMQDLGSIFPKNFNQVTEDGGGIYASFPYTPCWIGEFPEISSEDHLYRIFIGFHELRFPGFFYCPSMSTCPTAASSGKLNFMPSEYNDYYLAHHCNVLLFVNYNVVNPATRWWMPLTPLSDKYRFWGIDYIVFNSTVSPHCEVIKIPYFPHHRELAPNMRESEWPLSTMNTLVFLSVTRERAFVREGEAAGAIDDLLNTQQEGEHQAVYSRGALYVHEFFYVIRLSFSDGKYEVIKNPQCTNVDRSNPN